MMVIISQKVKHCELVDVDNVDEIYRHEWCSLCRWQSVPVVTRIKIGSVLKTIKVPQK